MTNYSEDSGSVRFDFFKPSGKWYMTEAIQMSKFYRYGGPREAAAKAWVARCRKLDRLPHDDFTIVVLDPYHELTYPIMLVAGTYADLLYKVEDE